MTTQTKCLSTETLTAISQGRCSGTELTDCESHLETCPLCCEALDRISADHETWNAARDFLADDPHDRIRFTDTPLANNTRSLDTERLLQFLAPTDDPHMLGRLGVYEISGVIGEGGMGIVLKGLDQALSRFVAIKVLAPRFWNDLSAQQRFVREARAAASIVHDNVIEIYGVAEFNGIPYFTMPYLRADSLQKRIDQQGPLKLTEILRIAKQIAEGLAAAHAQGLVHRDIKPANILLNDGADRVRITDFGIAQLGSDSRITQTGFVAGTPQYMSPEQIRGETVDSRSDLFSLGSVIYAMCTGRPPFESETIYKLLNQVVQAAPSPIEQHNPEIPSWLAAVIAKLHSVKLTDRYQTADVLATHLEQCLASVQQPDAAQLPQHITQLDARYHRRQYSFRPLLIAGGSLMFGLLLTAAFSSSLYLAAPAAVEPTPVVIAAERNTNAIDITGRVTDDKGKPVAKTTVLAVQKTWPNNQYQQRMLKTTTNKNGQFSFKEFAQRGEQYAFLLTVVSDKYLMVSDYRFVKDGSPQRPIRLKTKKVKPTSILFRDNDGKPVPNVAVLPSQRTTKNGDEFMTYAFHQLHLAGQKTDTQGIVEFGSWNVGDTAKIVYQFNGEKKEAQFVVENDQIFEVTLKPAQ